jgi:hypothetical protein
LSTKLHVVVDGCGLPLRVVLSPGQASDKAVPPALLAELAPGRDLVADRATMPRPCSTSSQPAAGAPTSRPAAIESASAPSTPRSTATATSSSASSTSSSTSAASPRATRKPHATSSPRSSSPQPASGHDLSPRPRRPGSPLL